jgi:hypothetical protein
VAAAGQAERFQAFDRVCIKPKPVGNTKGLGQLALSRYTVPLFISIFLSLSIPCFFLIFLFSFTIS